MESFLKRKGKGVVKLFFHPFPFPFAFAFPFPGITLYYSKIQTWPRIQMTSQNIAVQFKYCWKQNGGISFDMVFRCIVGIDTDASDTGELLLALVVKDISCYACNS